MEKIMVELCLVKAEHVSSIWMNGKLVMDSMESSIEKEFNNMRTALGENCSSSIFFSPSRIHPSSHESLQGYISCADGLYLVEARAQCLEFCKELNLSLKELYARHQVLCDNYITIVSNEKLDDEVEDLRDWALDQMLSHCLATQSINSKFKTNVKLDLSGMVSLKENRTLVAFVFWFSGIKEAISKINNLGNKSK